MAQEDEIIRKIAEAMNDLQNPLIRFRGNLEGLSEEEKKAAISAKKLSLWVICKPMILANSIIFFLLILFKLRILIFLLSFFCPTFSYKYFITKLFN